jgi:metal-responsive CopG/Arc/MetJ family transcriptional regulator
VVRIQLDIPDDQVKALDALMEEVGVATRKELFNNALALFDWAVRERKLGRIIASVNEDEKKMKELMMPSLETAASKERAAKLVTG